MSTGKTAKQNRSKANQSTANSTSWMSNVQLYKYLCTCRLWICWLV